MGYTHYWKMNLPVEDGAWKKLTSFSKKVFKKIEGAKTNTAGAYYNDKTVRLAYEDGELRGPAANMAYIRFNGRGALAHETFFLDRFRDSDFCKTARKPYDVAVVAILFKAQELGILRFTSDGDDDELKEGKNLFLEVK